MLPELQNSLTIYTKYIYYVLISKVTIVEHYFFSKFYYFSILSLFIILVNIRAINIYTINAKNTKQSDLC